MLSLVMSSRQIAHSVLVGFGAAWAIEACSHQAARGGGGGQQSMVIHPARQAIPHTLEVPALLSPTFIPEALESGSHRAAKGRTAAGGDQPSPHDWAVAEEKTQAGEPSELSAKHNRPRVT